MKLTLLFPVVIIVLTSTLLWGLASRQPVYLDDRCFANFVYTDNTDSHAFKFKGNVVLEFSPNKTGQFNLSGDVTYLGEKYMFSRYVKFNYINLKDNAYKIQILSQEVMGHDNVPETLSPLAMRIFFLSGEYSMYLKKDGHNLITIGNALSPLMNCVVHS